MNNIKYNMASLYQFIVLFSVIGLNVLVFIMNGELSEILLGALVGTMTGISISKK